MDDDMCDGCGADLNETDGNTFDMGDGSTIQLCPDCEARQDDEDEPEPPEPYYAEPPRWS